MSSSLTRDFARVSKNHPCPMCGHADWCMVERANIDDPRRILCQRVESPTKWGAAGYLHLRGLSARLVGQPRPIVLGARAGLGDDKLAPVANLAARCLHLANADAFAANLCVSLTSFQRLGLGWMDPIALADAGMSRRGGVWSFPMRDEFGHVCGIRLRASDGFKFAVKGSKNGLFVPTDLVGPLDCLLVAEGESDTAALLDLDFMTIGIPGAGNVDDVVVAFVRNLRPRRVVVVADNDATGTSHASALAAKIAVRHTDVRVITPPPGIKDARDLKKAGGDHDAVARAISAAKPVTFTFSATRKEA